MATLVIEGIEYKLEKNNIHVVDSYKVPKKKIKPFLTELRKRHEHVVLENRSDCSLKSEWVTHTFLYNLKIRRSSTKDVDLNYPQKWYVKIGYIVVGILGLIFTK